MICYMIQCSFANIYQYMPRKPTYIYSSFNIHKIT